MPKPSENAGMARLAHLQDDFAEALLSTTTPVPSCVKGAGVNRADRRFAVYRNNVAASLIEALAARFPVVKRLVGEAFFNAMAHAYVLREPPFSPLLIHYGETFPAFVEAFEAARPLPYLGDVARIEVARGRAYHAADADPLPRQAFADLPKDRIAAHRVVLHPSVTILASAYPALSIWEINQTGGERPVESWGPEAAAYRPAVPRGRDAAACRRHRDVSARAAERRHHRRGDRSRLGCDRNVQRRRRTRGPDRRQSRGSPQRRPLRHAGQPTAPNAITPCRLRRGTRRHQWAGAVAGCTRLQIR